MDHAIQLPAARLMGWLALLLVGLLAFGLLVATGLRRPLWSLAGAALMLGAAGYALQGWPTLSSSPASAQQAARTDDSELLDLRTRMLGRFGSDGAYVVAADAMARAGEDRAAVQALLAGIGRYPDSTLLWTALGSALAAHDGGRVSPPALFAFQQAARLSPEHPAPPFFLGTAYVRAGDFAAAKPLWQRALSLSPAEASYRRDIAVRLMLLDKALADPDIAGRQ